MVAYVTPDDLALRHWSGEETGVVRVGLQGTTHLVASEALAVLQAVLACGRPVGQRDIAHTLGLDLADDIEVQTGLQRIIDGLVLTGLLRERLDDAEPGGDQTR